MHQIIEIVSVFALHIVLEFAVVVTLGHIILVCLCKSVFRAVDTIESLSRNIFGLFLQEKDSDLTQEQRMLLQERLNARKKKDFKRSDNIRDLLKEKGVIVEDTKDGQVWRWA